MSTWSLKALLANHRQSSILWPEPPPISNTLLAFSLHVLFGAAIVFTKEGTTGMVRAINLSLGSEVWYKAERCSGEKKHGFKTSATGHLSVLSRVKSHFHGHSDLFEWVQFCRSRSLSVPLVSVWEEVMFQVPCGYDGSMIFHTPLRDSYLFHVLNRHCHWRSSPWCLVIPILQSRGCINRRFLEVAQGRGHQTRWSSCAILGGGSSEGFGEQLVGADESRNIGY